MLTETEIIKAGKECGFDLIGLFNVNPLEECFDRLTERYQAGKITGFEGEIPKHRINYHYFYPAAKTGIALGLNYYHPLEKPLDIKKRGEIAAVARGLDYHSVLRNKSQILMEHLNKRMHELKLPMIEYKIFIDNSGLIDRGSAYRASLGFFGKNNCLINEEYGSFFFIGQILINQEIIFKKKDLQVNKCGSCRLCIEACPTTALGDFYQFDPQKCISFLTQKKTITKAEEKTFTNYLYGCDICQNVCPYNQNLKKTNERSFYITQEKAYPKLKDILEMSNRQFKKEFSHTAAGWRGKKNMVRNAKLIMKNRCKVL